MRTFSSVATASGRTAYCSNWTAEPDKRRALTEFAHRPTWSPTPAVPLIRSCRKIQDRDFRVVSIPERTICKECDLKPCAPRRADPPFERTSRWRDRGHEDRAGLARQVPGGRDP